MPKPFLLFFILLPCALLAQQRNVRTLKTQTLAGLQQHYGLYKKIADSIWAFAEVGFKEERSAALLQQTLADSGFAITKGVAGMPTAFVATYGSGSPVIGILAEYDALPGLAQEAVPQKSPVAGKEAGHACGHHLFGTASVAAAIAIKKMLQDGTLKGTLKLYGTSAEEGGSGKVYMVREGLFAGVDAVLHWHPGAGNGISMTKALANTSAKFRFSGVSAHASASPEQGRSALDAVEAMDYMVNLMREHMPADARIHYVITNGGKAPNVVPDFAEVYYYVRHPSRNMVRQLFERVVKAANGAATGTETKMSYEIIGGTYDLLINKTLAVAMQKNLEMVGGVTYTAAEKTWAQTLRKSLDSAAPALETAAQVAPLKEEGGSGGGSTDVGDVSWNVPTVGLRAATWVPGTPAHSWQAVACGGTEIGTKGMMVAAKTLALTAIDLFTDATLIEKAKAEFAASRSANFVYKPLLGNRAPALNYRN